MTSTSSSQAKRFLRCALQGVALGGVALAAVLIVTTGPETREELRHFPWHYLALPVAMTFCAWCCNAARLWLLADALGHPISYRRSLAVALSTEFGVAATPAGMGGPVTRLALLKKSGVPLTTSASMLAVDVAADVVFFSLALAAALVVLLADSSWQPVLASVQASPIKWVVPAALAVFAAVAFILWNGNWVGWLHDLSMATPLGRRYRLPGRLRRLRWTLRRSAHRTVEVTRFMFRHRRRALLINVGLSLLQWLCRYGVLPVILMMFGTARNPIPLIPAQGFLFALSAVLVLPGGGGGVEVATPFILRHFVPGSVVGVAILLWRLCTYHLYLLVGGTVFAVACKRFDLFGERDTAQGTP